jgi:hypothetical protein
LKQLFSTAQRGRNLRQFEFGRIENDRMFMAFHLLLLLLLHILLLFLEKFLEFESRRLRE